MIFVEKYLGNDYFFEEMLMNIEKKTYKKYAAAHAPTSPIIKDCIMAFFIGGAICAAGQGLLLLYRDALGIAQKDAGTWVSVTIIKLPPVVKRKREFGKKVYY